MQSFLLFSASIKERYNDLSLAEKKIADYMLENPKIVVDETSRGLSAKLGVSPATIVRFCRSCGFEGLTDLKLSLQREYMALNEGPADSDAGTIALNDSVTIIKQKVLGYHSMIINLMLSNWNEDAYKLAADAILAAERIIILGEGGSKCTATCLYSILLNLGMRCEIYSDAVFETCAIDTLTERDLVIGITYTGRIRNTFESIRLAKQRGAVTIGLIGYLKSPIMEFIDIVLHTTNVKKDYYDSGLSTRVSEIAVIEILSTMLSMRLNKPIREPASVEIKRI